MKLIMAALISSGVVLMALWADGDGCPPGENYEVVASSRFGPVAMCR